MTIKEKEEKSKNVLIHYARRAIKHKDFRDITAAQADSELQTKSIDSNIFRPSSKSKEHLPAKEIDFLMQKTGI